MARIANIVGHVKSPSFCDALAEAYRDAALAAGDTVDVIATPRMTLDPILREGFARLQPLEIGSIEAIGDAGRKRWRAQVEVLGRSVR